MTQFDSSNRLVEVECELGAFLDSVLEGLGIEPSVDVTSQMCIFGTDLCSACGEVLADVADELSDRPLTCVRDNRVPGWVGPDTTAVLVSVDSCPGAKDVEDILRERGCQVLRVSRDDSEIRMPPHCTGSRTLGFTLGALVKVACSTGQFDSTSLLRDAVESVRSQAGSLVSDAAELCTVLDGRVGAFYSTSDTHACAIIMREILSSGCGRLTFVGELPEFDHNELVGWSDPNSHAEELSMVVLRGVSESDLVNRIVGCMMQVLDENGRPVSKIDLGDGCVIRRDLRGIAFAISAARFMEVS